MEENEQVVTQSEQCETEKEAAEHIVQVNFRAPDSMANWIKQRSKEEKKKQEKFLADVVEGYMLQVAAEEFPSRGTEVSDFKSRIMELHRMYVNSVTICEHTQKRVREEFRASLESKDRIISDYQKEIQSLKTKISILDEANAFHKSMQEDMDDMRNQSQREQNTLERRISEKDRLISMLDADLEKYRSMLEGYDAMRASRDTLAEQLRETNAAIKEMEMAHELALERAAIQAEAAILRDLRAETDNLREKLGEQKARLEMLTAQKERVETEAAELRGLSQRQAAEIERT